MASFEAAFTQRVKSMKEDASKARDLKTRVLVDPLISVDQIQTALEGCGCGGH